MLSRGTIPAPPNHTHSHLVLTEIGSERYCGEIDLADRHLDPWLSKAPNRFFRYTLCLWGDTEERRAKGLAHLAVTREHRRAKTDRLDTWVAGPLRTYRRTIFVSDDFGVDDPPPETYSGDWPLPKFATPLSHSGMSV